MSGTVEHQPKAPDDEESLLDGDKQTQMDSCPPGLGCLSDLEEVIIQQQLSQNEVTLLWDVKNKYELLDKSDMCLYTIEEECGWCMRWICGPGRSSIMHVYDNQEQEIMRMSRKFKCCGGCGACADNDRCGWELAVEVPVGNVIGYARQTKSWWYPHLAVLDAERKPLYYTWGPCCPFQGPCCKKDIDFQILSFGNDNIVCRISKVWSGIGAAFAEADRFSIKFPRQLPVLQKAVVLGSAILIEFMCFEKEKSN